MEKLRFALDLRCLCPDEEAWLRAELKKTAQSLVDEDFGEVVDGNGHVDADAEGYFCSWKFSEAGDMVTLFSNEYANVNEVGKFVQRYLAKWRPNETRTMSWGLIGGFTEHDSYGGGMRITAHGIASVETVPWETNPPATCFTAKLRPGSSGSYGRMVALLRQGALGGWRVIHCEYDPAKNGFTNCFIIIEGCHSLANWPALWSVDGGELELQLVVNSPSVGRFNFGPVE